MLNLKKIERHWAKIAKKVRDRERRFKNMTKNRQRVAIAKDVIEALETDRIIAEQGVYTRIGDEINDALGYDQYLSSGEHDDIATEQLQRLLPALPPCSACALGSLFICAVMRNDKLEVGFESYLWGNRNNLTDYLGEFFEQSQLDLIEGAFETGFVSFRNYYGGAEVVFGSRFKSAEDKMVAIMKNIVKNDGDFRPATDPQVAALLLGVG